MTDSTVINLGLVETILIIIVPIGTAIGFWVRLEMKVRSLERQIEENPLLSAFKQIEKDSVIEIFSEYLKKTPMEKKDE